MMVLWMALMGLAQADEVETSGYIRPAIQGIYRPTAVPLNQQDVQLSGSTAGLIFAGSPGENWSFRTHLRLGSRTVDAVTSVAIIDTDNNGEIDDVVSTRSEVMGQILREASVTYQPIDELAVQAGRLIVPFTSQAQASDTALLFSERSGPDRVFHADDDLGAMVVVNLADRVNTSLGLFNGDGMGVDLSRARGSMYMARLDINPLGNFEFDESSPQTQDFRLGIGGGLLWHAYSLYDSAGYPNVFVGDLRASGSVRLAVAGLSVAGEVLYRVQRDDLMDRPLQATGAFGQAGWRSSFGIEPMFRVGTLVEDQTFAPRTTQWLEAGMNYYPHQQSEDPNAVRLTLQYTGENRITEQEIAHGVVGLLQLVWD
jgi:hypothetical protein